MARRRLTADEIALWRKVTARAQRMHPETAIPDLPAPAPKSPVPKPPLPKPRPAKPPLDQPVSRSPAAPARPPLNMDRKTFARMTRGKLTPERRIDLHGMTLDRAHGALTRFILTAQADGKRMVLVITGKGRPDRSPDPVPQARGVLRRQVPHWLEIPPLAQAVLQITPAHLRHGGDGALYVYLRKPG